THDQVEAMGLGDRIVVMDGGKVRQIGTPEEIYRSPADTFVATFIGTPPMNLVTGTQYTIGFRAEAFVPEALHQGPQPDLQIDFRVKRLEFLGGDRLIYGSVDQELGGGNAI